MAAFEPGLHGCQPNYTKADMAIASASSLRLAIFMSAFEGNAVMSNHRAPAPCRLDAVGAFTAGISSAFWAAADVLEPRTDENDPVLTSA